MIEVEARQSFEHSGSRKRGDRFEVSEAQAKGLERAGLVRVLGDGPTKENPSTAAGAKLSASPAAPASPKKTAKPSEDGVKRKRGRPKKEVVASS